MTALELAVELDLPVVNQGTQRLLRLWKKGCLEKRRRVNSIEIEYYLTHKGFRALHLNETDVSKEV